MIYTWHSSYRNTSRDGWVTSPVDISTEILEGNYLSNSFISIHFTRSYPCLPFSQLSPNFQYNHSRTVIYIPLLFKLNLEKPMRALPKWYISVIIGFSLLHQITSITISNRQKNTALLVRVKKRGCAVTTTDSTVIHIHPTRDSISSI